MEEIEDYLLLLSTNDKELYEKIYEKLSKIETPPLQLELENVFLHQLLEKPYPILQILTPLVYKHKIIQNVIYGAFDKYLEQDLIEDRQKSMFLNFLANFDLPAHFDMQITEIILPKIYDKSNALSRNLYFCLLAKRNNKLLESYLQLESQMLPVFNKRSILYKTIYKEEHAIVDMIKEDCIPEIKVEFFRNAICILKLVNYINASSPILEDFNKLNRIFSSFSVSHMNSIQKMFYSDLCWTHNILKFVRKYSYNPIDVQQLLQDFTTLDVLYKHTPILHIGYEECKNFLENNINLKANNLFDSTKKCKELEELSHFFLLVIFFEIIVCRSKIPDIITEKLSTAHAMFRQIKDIDRLNNLIEDIFRLFFLRWEHLKSLSKSQEYRNISSGTDNVDTNYSATTATTALTERYGFICRESAVKEILQFLKVLITKRFHTEEYKTTTTENQKKFNKISEKINHALWKYNLIERNSTENDNSFVIESKELVRIVQHHYESWGHVSSDEEIKERRYSNASRRKIKIKKRNSLISSYASKEKSKEDNTIKPNVPLTKKDRHVIAKMLGPAENLVLLLLNVGNLTEAKQIIQLFHLQNSEYEKELNFLENLQQAKKKLHTIYEKYKGEEMQKSPNPSTIQRIRRAAAVGFEVSKITNVIEKFTFANLIKQDDESEKLMQKFSNNLPFLQQYIGNSLQMNVILDVVLNSQFDYEISFNILSLAERLFGQNVKTNSIANIQDSNHTQNNLLDTNLGCFAFFKNLVECMHLWKNTKQSIVNVRNALINNCYPLKADKLAAKLTKDEIFWKVFTKNSSEIGCLKDLKALLKSFEELNATTNYFSRLYSYLANLTKLLQLKDKNIDIPTTEMIGFDLKVIIGDLVFEENMTPLELESVIASLNLNFLHIIALNICPDISRSSKELELCLNKRDINANNQSILNYITTQNNLLGYLLKRINNIDPDMHTINKNYFNRIINLQETQNISPIFGNNLAIAALLQDTIDIKRISSINDKFTLVLIANSFTENVNDWEAIHQLRNRTIAEEFLTGDKIQFLELICDINLYAKLLIDNYTKIHDSCLAERLINSILLHRDIEKLPENLKIQLRDTLREIQVYAEIALIYNFRTWTQAYDFSLISPALIMETLFKEKEFGICFAWSKIINLPEKFSSKMKSFFTIFLTSLIEISADIDRNLLDLIERFPLEDVLQFYDTNLEKFRSLSLLEYVINFLSKNNDHLKPIYENYKISLKIFEQLSKNERELNWNIFSKPLLLIEQLIMNTKFDSLSTVLNATRQNLFKSSLCKYCTNKQGSVYNIYSKSATYTLGSENASEFLLLNFNLYQKDHIVTNDCIDLILRIYATKALDYHINEIYSSSEKVSQSTDLTSLDSLCGTFIMPKEAPKKENWIKDEDAVQCMCCRRAVFTMLIRRHHCRRCGRVICFSCSGNRLKITELYQEVPVRVCNDCLNQTQALENKTNKITPSPEGSTTRDRQKSEEKWLLSGNLTYDKLLREEFCYEHTPSVALCLSILSYHIDDEEYIKLLLYHCRKLEKLLKPNPEVDFALLAKMLNCLAVAAKVRGGPPECDTIRDHSEIIMSVVQNGCEALLPMEPLTNHSLRKLGDALVSVEKWSLALDVFLKCGFPTAGVKAAHGLLCLRAGCFDTAREKFCHCLTRLCNEDECAIISKLITNDSDTDLNIEIIVPSIKRPNRSPPLLEEIIKIIESTTNIPRPETIARASIIRSSNTSLSSNRSKRKENIPIHEPALNILNTLSNLKRISKGNYGESLTVSLDNKKFIKRQSRMFEECLYYILSYGSHADVINFLIRHDEMSWALQYYILQNITSEIFIQNIYLKYLQIGRVEELVKEMLKLDDRLLIWKDAIINTCRYLETKNLLNCLYQLQVLLNDPVRASMTCVKFYSMNCSSFRELQNNAFHLLNAKKHLQTELELCQWEDINIERRREPLESSFLMQINPKSLNNHINTIMKQLEVAKFLSKYEEEKATTTELLKQIRLDTPGVPTLFDSIHDKIQICILILLSGKNIEEGFGLTFGIMQDYKLSPIKVYGATVKCLSRNGRLNEIEGLIKCIVGNNGKDKQQIDEILSIAVNAAVNIHEPSTKTVLDNLIKKIENVDMKISCYIYIGQLKAAYLTAVQFNKINDIRKILRHAETTNQIHIKKLCEKKLNINN